MRLPGGIPQQRRAQAPVTPTIPSWQTAEWFPELYRLMGQRLGQQENLGLDRMLRELRWGLGRTGLPGNMPNVLANTVLSRYGQGQNPAEKMMQTMGMAQMFAPMFESWWGEKSPLYQKTYDPTRFLPQFLSRLWGGGR